MPEPLWKVPGPQSWQLDGAVMPLPDWYVPPWQNVHEVAGPVRKVPSTHMLQETSAKSCIRCRLTQSDNVSWIECEAAYPSVSHAQNLHF